MKWGLLIIVVAAVTVIVAGMMRMKTFGKELKAPTAEATPTPSPTPVPKVEAAPKATSSPTPSVISVTTNRDLPIPSDAQFAYTAGQPNALGVTKSVYKGVAKVEPREDAHDFLVVTSAAVAAVEYERFCGRVQFEDLTFDAILTENSTYRLGRSARGGRVEKLEENRVTIACADGSKIYVVDSVMIEKTEKLSANGQAGTKP